jgi:fructose-1,6-bisphosphatase/inositol monophosphatase family enzyme
MLEAPPPALPESSVLPLLRRVDELGSFLVERQPTISFTYKSDGTILSELDVEIQRAIRSFVRTLDCAEACTAHFVGEEEDPGSDVSRVVIPGRWNWIVDAIDGTAAYTKGVNTFGISIALVDEECRPALGVIHLPAWHQRCDVAWLGSLYRWRGGELAPAGDSGLPEGWDAAGTAPVWRSYIYGNSDLHRHGLDAFRGKVRNLGGTAAHLALLAERSDDPVAVVLSRCQTWDIAAGLALAAAAGMEIRHGSDWAVVEYADLIQAPDLKARLPVIVGLPDALEILEPELRGRLH